MSSKLLGVPFDIHGGGMDLRFPHHENEIAQAEAATGNSFAKYWMHIGLLTVNGEKMSKSIGNIINVRDLLQKRDAEVLRMFFSQAHYRSPPDFSEKALTDIEKGLERLYRMKERLGDCAKTASKQKPMLSKLTDDENQYIECVKKFQDEFEQAMDDDFNTPKAFASLFEFINKSNKFFEQQLKANPDLCAYVLNTYLKIGNVLTLFQPKTIIFKTEDKIEIQDKLEVLLQKSEVTAKSASMEDRVHALLNAREDARKHKDWKTADNIRKNLEALGFEIQDTAHGPVWRKK
jgi:cysteinyl-tRNA synthetase